MSGITLPVFENARVTVVGDVMLDHYSHGATERISPEAPVPIVLVTETQHRAGGAANVAMNIAELGCQTRLAGCIGTDDNGRSLQAIIEKNGIFSSLIRLSGFVTNTKHRVLSHHQQLLRVDKEQLVPNRAQAQLHDHVSETLLDTDVLVISDYAKGAVTRPESLIQQARAAGIQVLVDPKGSDFSCYRGASLITPNLKEFEAVVGRCDSQDKMVDYGYALISSLELDALLITLGKDGMLLLVKDSQPLHIPARAKSVFDVTGAGDTVIATIAASLAANQSLADAVRLANVAASWVVGQVGTTAITLDQLQIAISKTGSVAKCVTQADLRSLVQHQQVMGETIVMTNGCFDLLHPGHIDYLEEAKALGHRLIVAVNDDASVTRLKGSSRPINTLQRRMRVLAGLQCVDWVVSFSDETPAALIEMLAPDILVKGGDYKISQIAGSEFVLAQGGQVTTIPLTPDCSTSATIEKIHQECLT